MSGLFRVSTASVRQQIRENEFYRCVFSPFVEFISIARVTLEQNRLIPVRVLSCVVRQFDCEYDHVRRHLRLCPLMADETDAGMEAPAPESVRRDWRSFRLEPFLPYVFTFSLAALDRRASEWRAPLL